MKLTERSETLLNRYLLAVERHLPFQGRKDMIAEIKSNLLDRLEDQYPGEEAVDESQLEAQLRLLGAPRAVASQYFPSESMIAPQYNTVFRLVVTRLTPIVIGAVVFAGLLSFALSGGEKPFWSIWELIGTGWQVGVGIIGTTAIILMLLSHFFPQFDPNKGLNELESDEKNWRVSELPELMREQDKVHVWELAVGIFFGLVGIIFWLFYFDKLAGIWWRIAGNWQMIPIFTAVFKAFIPWIAINTALDVLTNVVMLVKGRRVLTARLIEIGTNISEISLVGAMLRAGTLVSLDQQLAISKGFPSEAIATIQKLLETNAVHWLLIATIVGLSIGLLANLVNLFRRALTRLP